MKSPYHAPYLQHCVYVLRLLRYVCSVVGFGLLRADEAGETSVAKLQGSVCDVGVVCGFGMGLGKEPLSSICRLVTRNGKEFRD